MKVTRRPWDAIEGVLDSYRKRFIVEDDDTEMVAYVSCGLDAEIDDKEDICKNRLVIKTKR